MKFLPASKARLLSMTLVMSNLEKAINLAASHGEFKISRNLPSALSEDDVQALIELIESAGYRVTGDELFDHILIIEWS